MHDILEKIHTLEIEEQERTELTEKVVSIVHLEMLEAVLSLIPESEHEIFLKNIQIYTHPHKVFEPHGIAVDIIETVVKRRGERVIAEIRNALVIE